MSPETSFVGHLHPGPAVVRLCTTRSCSSTQPRSSHPAARRGWQGRRAVADLQAWLILVRAGTEEGCILRGRVSCRSDRAVRSSHHHDIQPRQGPPPPIRNSRRSLRCQVLLYSSNRFPLASMTVRPLLPAAIFSSKFLCGLALARALAYLLARMAWSPPFKAARVARRQRFDLLPTAPHFDRGRSDDSLSPDGGPSQIDCFILSRSHEV